jgi:hypothetical protein
VDKSGIAFRQLLMSLNKMQTQFSDLTLRENSNVNSAESRTRIMTDNSSDQDVLQSGGQPQQEEPRAMATSQAAAQILAQQQIPGADQPPEFLQTGRYLSGYSTLCRTYK